MAVTYYYYAYMENGICVDVERNRTPKSDMTSYIEITQEQYEASYDGDYTSEYFIIGKVYNNGVWADAPSFFYAVLNEKQIVKNFIASRTEIEEPDFIPVPQSYYDTQEYLNRRYNATTGMFDAVDFTEYADADTNMITVNGSNVTLQDVITSIQNAINNTQNLSAIDILAMLSQVDGATSCLDADMLDGKDSSAFATVAQLANYVQASQLGNYATTAQLSNYATKDQLGSYATRAQLNGLLEFGNYAGSTTEGGETIYLGYRPRAVLIFPSDGKFKDDSGRTMGGFFIDGCECGNGTGYGVQITDTGFIAYSYKSDKLGCADGNKTYIAIR